MTHPSLLPAFRRAAEVSADEIERLKSEIERLQEAKRAALAVADERSKDNVALRAALKECADDLENELKERYGEIMYYPHQRIKFDRDMAPVVKARALLVGHEQSSGDSHA